MYLIVCGVIDGDEPARQVPRLFFVASYQELRGKQVPQLLDQTLVGYGKQRNDRS